jgi:hypothetical protein
MLRWFRRNTDDSEAPRLPSIYEHIRAHLRAEGPGLTEGGETLPDEEEHEQGGIRWAPGALEGVLSHHTESWGDPAGGEEAGQPPERRAAELYAAIVRLAERPGRETRAQVREMLVREDTPALIGPVIERLAERPPRDQQQLYEEMQRFCLEGTHRAEVKHAMAILSCFGNPEDAPLFHTLGRHEEFTRYAAAALASVASDPVPEWLDLAGKVTGWGKIQLVELLLQHPEPEVCDWLLRHGCPNDIMNGYTAWPIATGCRLHETLARESVDLDLLRGAADILGTLAEDAIGHGPDGDMWDYPEGGEASERFLALFEPHASRLEDYVAVDALYRFAGAEAEEERYRSCGWDRPRRTHILELGSRILGRPDWAGKARDALDSPDPVQRWLGLTVAKRLGLPLQEYLVARLESDPLDSTLWYELVHNADEARMDEALALARRLLDLESIATGPAEESGFGPDFKPHYCLDFLLPELGRFPGKGWDVIRPALRSPVIRNRYQAAKALHAWPPSTITREMREALRECLNDPYEDLRNLAREILAQADSATQDEI